MAYSDFTLDRLIRDFGVEVRGERSLFPNAPLVEPSPWLIESLQRANNVGFGSEKSRSERLVSPVLVELSNLNQDAFAIISGANLDIDASRGLNGECDFILSFTRLQDFVQAPVFCITEAKKQDVEMGTAQCAAQLLGAAQLNQQAQRPISTLYGCSTTGVEWRFLRFENNVFVLDETRYLINEPTKLLGVLQQIVDWQLFAQRSTPLEGVYFTTARNTTHLLRFHRDGTFNEARGEGRSTESLLPQTDKYSLGGTYVLYNGKLTLYFTKSNNKDSIITGSVNAVGELQVMRYGNQDEILTYDKYLA